MQVLSGHYSEKKDLDPFGGEFGEFWRCLSYLDPFHVYLDPFMFT